MPWAAECLNAVDGCSLLVIAMRGADATPAQRDAWHTRAFSLAVCCRSSYTHTFCVRPVCIDGASPVHRRRSAGCTFIDWFWLLVVDSTCCSILRRRCPFFSIGPPAAPTPSHYLIMG